MFVLNVIGEAIWIACDGMKGGQDGPDEALGVVGVFVVHSTCFAGQPAGRLHITRSVEWSVLSYGQDEFRYAVQDESAAASVPMVFLIGQMSGDRLQIEVLCVVDVVDWRGEVCWHPLLALLDVTHEDCVESHDYANGSTTHTALTV